MRTFCTRYTLYMSRVHGHGTYPRYKITMKITKKRSTHRHTAGLTIRIYRSPRSRNVNLFENAEKRGAGYKIVFYQIFRKRYPFFSASKRRIRIRTAMLKNAQQYVTQIKSIFFFLFYTLPNALLLSFAIDLSFSSQDM